MRGMNVPIQGWHMICSGMLHEKQLTAFWYYLLSIFDSLVMTTAVAYSLRTTGLRNKVTAFLRIFCLHTLSNSRLGIATIYHDLKFRQLLCCSNNFQFSLL